MSTDKTATDTMRKYETDQDSGDTNTPATTEPAVSPAPDTDYAKINNTGSEAPIPMATPQSPVQTESDTAETEDSPEVKEDNSPEVRSNKGNESEGDSREGDRVYREARLWD